LRNLGNSCYVNSVLQSLSSIVSFREFFLQLPDTLQNKVVTSDMILQQSLQNSPSNFGPPPLLKLQRANTLLLFEDAQTKTKFTLEEVWTIHFHDHLPILNCLFFRSDVSVCGNS
jgi:ubiquitin C-terminal hydrolase